MSGSKAALKAINDAIRTQNFDDAITKAQDLVDKDPKSYQGYLDHGLFELETQFANDTIDKYSWHSL